MSAPDLPAEMRDALAQAMLDAHRASLGFEPIPLDDCAGPDDYQRPADALAPLIAGWLAEAEARGERKAVQQGQPIQRWIEHGRDIGRAEVAASVEAICAELCREDPMSEWGEHGKSQAAHRVRAALGDAGGALDRVRAEALQEAADDWETDIADPTPRSGAHADAWLRRRADRIAESGGADA